MHFWKGKQKIKRKRHTVGAHNTSLFHCFEKGLDMSENVVILIYLQNMIHGNAENYLTNHKSFWRMLNDSIFLLTFAWT